MPSAPVQTTQADRFVTQSIAIPHTSCHPLKCDTGVRPNYSGDVGTDGLTRVNLQTHYER